MPVLGLPRRKLGVWFTTAEIVFAIVEGGQREVMHGRVPRSKLGRAALLDSHPPNVEIVVTLPRTLIHYDPLIAMARDLGIPRWFVSWELVKGLCRLSGITLARPELTATLLARIPDANLPTLCSQLAREPRQQVADTTPQLKLQFPR